MDKKVVIVTGGAGGIGRSIGQAFGEAGSFVICVDHDEQGGVSWAKSMKVKGYAVEFIPVDLADVKQIKTLHEQIEKKLQGIDVLINNAGVGGFCSLRDLTEEKWDSVLAVNLKSMVFMAKHSARLMKKRGGGRIINISSTRQQMSEPGSEAYAASKGGVASLTHALAASLARDHITVNAISPGWIETENYQHLRREDHLQHFSGRVGCPDDIARLCLFLSEDKNNFINGENISIDGGMTRKMMYVD